MAKDSKKEMGRDAKTIGSRLDVSDMDTGPRTFPSKLMMSFFVENLMKNVDQFV